MKEDEKPPFGKGSYLRIRNKNRIKKYIFNELRKAGWSKESAIGMIGNLSHESAQFTKFTEGASNIYNTKGIGLMQWTDNPNVDENGKPKINKKTGKALSPDMRGQAFLSWTKKNNYETDSLEGNVKYMIHEMKVGYYISGKEGVGPRSTAITGSSYNQLKSQTNINEATALLTKSLYRPAKDENGDFLGAKERLNYAIHFNSIEDKIHVNSTEKGFKNLSDEDNLKNYKKYSQDLKDENVKLSKGKRGEEGGITQEVYNENVYQIKKDAQLKYGNENLSKGNKLFNTYKEETWKKGNKNYQKTIPLDKKIKDLELKKNIGEIDSTGREELKILKQKRNAYLANIRINSDTKKVEQLKSDIKNGKIAQGTHEFEEAVTNLKSAKKNIRDLKYRHTLIKVNKDPYAPYAPYTSTIDFHLNKNNETLGPEYELKDKDENGDYKETSLYGQKTYYDPTSFEGDFNQSSEDLWGTETYTSTPLNEEDLAYYNDSKDLTYNPNKNYSGIDYKIKDSKGNVKTIKPVKKPDIDFTQTLDSKDLLLNAPSLYQDDLDAREKQSAKGFLKNNPMAVLSAALGVKGLVDSQKKTPDLNIKDSSSLSSSFYEYLDKLETISKQGFTPEEEAAHLKKINDGYMASVDLAVQASGGNRAQVLAQASGLNANKNDALLNYSSADAQLNRQNLEKYGKALEYSESFNERKDLRQQTNDYISKKAKYDQALSKQKGGALLAAGSIKSLVDSISSYKETGEGSILDNYRKHMLKKLENEQTRKGPDGKIFKNEEDFKRYNDEQSTLIKSNNRLSVTLAGFVKNAGSTRDESEILKKQINTLNPKELNSYLSSINKDSTKEQILNPFAVLNPKEELVEEENSINGINGIDGIDYLNPQYQ